MTERMRESLSALLDNEANELEVERVLSQIGDNPELRQTWVRYNAVRSVTGGQRLSSLSLDISVQVREAVAAEQGRQGAASPLKRMMKPFASFAVAASVAATVVIGGQQLSQIGSVNGGAGANAVAGGVSPVGLVNTLGATSVQASYGTSPMPMLQPAARTAYRELARERMQKYMQEHAEHAALNSPHGLIPFARVQQIQE